MDVGCRYRQLLAEVHLPSELVDRTLAQRDLIARGAGAQPVRERALSDLSPRRIQQLEHRSAAEQIQIARVGMTFAEMRSVAPSSCPLVEQPVDPALVHAPRLIGPLAPLEQPRVDDEKRDERQNRQEDPASPERGADQGEPHGHGDARGDGKPEA